MSDPYREPIKEAPATDSAVAPESTPTDGQETTPRPEKENLVEQAAPAEQPAAPSAATTAPADGNNSQAAAIAQDARNLRAYEKNQQLKALVDLAFAKGVAYAADVARRLDSPYLMDEFHDTLVDKLHKELVQRGKLEEV